MKHHGNQTEVKTYMHAYSGFRWFGSKPLDNNPAMKDLPHFLQSGVTKKLENGHLSQNG